MSDPRPEHIGAITWLNESIEASFYLIKVEAIRIGDSPAAPLLTLITGPSNETREVGAKKHERKERHDLREAFWTTLLERARPRTKLHSGVSPGTDSWLSAGSGRSGIHYSYVIRKDDAAVQLVIESADAQQNQAIFAALAQDRLEIENVFGEPLEWDRVEGRKRCAISKRLNSGGRENEDYWPEIQDVMIDRMIQLELALAPRIAGLPT